MSNPLLAELPYNIEKSPGMAPFWEGLNNEELKTTRCNKCEAIHYPPSPILCPKCFGRNMEWISLPLEGTVVSWTYVTAPPNGFSGEYMLVSVEIDKLEKPVLGRFKGEEVAIGDRVNIEFEKIGDQSMFIFTE